MDHHKQRAEELQFSSCLSSLLEKIRTQAKFIPKLIKINQCYCKTIIGSLDLLPMKGHPCSLSNNSQHSTDQVCAQLSQGRYAPASSCHMGGTRRLQAVIRAVRAVSSCCYTECEDCRLCGVQVRVQAVARQDTAASCSFGFVWLCLQQKQLMRDNTTACKLIPYNSSRKNNLLFILISRDRVRVCSFS